MLKQVLLRSLFLPILFYACDANAQVYRLASGSHYLEGCISGLCECPIQFTMGLEGEMRVIRVGSDEFEVRDVSWEVFSDSQPLHFTGDGRYELRGDGFLREQRMQLALSVKGGEAVPYDSGWIALRSGSDAIDLDLPMAEIVCYGSAFGVRAVPSSPVATDEASWSTIKSRW